MKSLWFLAQCTLLLITGQTSCDATSRRGHDAEEVSRLEREVGEAMTRRDIARLGELLAEDFEATNPVGVVMRRSDVVALVSSPDYDLESLENQDVRVRLFGNVALATARGVARGRLRGRDASSEFTYLRVWVRRDGRWQAVAAQATPSSSPEVP